MRVFTRKWRPEGQFDLWIFSQRWMWVVTEKCDRTTGCELTVTAPVQHGSLLAPPCEPSFREAICPHREPTSHMRVIQTAGVGCGGIEAICLNSIGVWGWELGKGFACSFVLLLRRPQASYMLSMHYQWVTWACTLEQQILNPISSLWKSIMKPPKV